MKYMGGCGAKTVCMISAKLQLSQLSMMETGGIVSEISRLSRGFNNLHLMQGDTFMCDTVKMTI